MISAHLQNADDIDAPNLKSVRCLPHVDVGARGREACGFGGALHRLSNAPLVCLVSSSSLNPIGNDASDL